MPTENTRENPRDNPPPGPAPRKVSKRVIRVCEALGWTALLVLAAVFLGLRYWLLPNVEQYREQIVAAVSRNIELPIKVDAISADWQGFRPQLDLENVRIYDPQGREALVLPHVHNVVSWRSLLYRDLRLHAVELSDLKLTVRRGADGSITIGGIRLSEQAGDGKLTDWVLGQREIVVSNAEIDWIDERRGAPLLALSDLNFRLRNAGDEHAIGLSARPPAALGSSFEVRAELIGSTVTQPSAWTGRVFAEVGNTDLAAWRAWIDYPIDVRAGLGALRVWAKFDEGKVKRVTADLVMSKVVARLGKDLPVLELASVSGRMKGRDSSSFYELSGRNLRLVPEHAPELPPSSFQLVLQRGPGERIERGSLTADAIELEPLARLAGYLPFPPEVRKLLSEIEPRGALLDVKFDWHGPLSAAEKYTARGRFAALGMNAWGRIPGFANLSGSVDANESKGTLYLASQAAELDLPRVFPEPRLKLDSLNGEFGWERGAPAAPETITVRLANIGFANPHAAGTAFGSYAYDGSGPGTIDLSAQLSRADGREVERYLPAVVGEGVRRWLKTAIVAGHSSDARMRLRGDLRDFPFVDPAKGQFQIVAKVDNGTLDYAEGWPHMEEVQGEMLFERDKVEVVGRSATIFGTRLSGIRVSIPSLLEPERTLHVTGVADGPSGDFLRYIQASPVRRMLSGFTDAMAASGRGRLRLKLDLPLGGLDKSRVDGDFQFGANTLTVDARLPPIERAAGRIEFTENTITVRDVKGAMLGGTTSISGGTARTDGQVVFTARGDATVAGIRPVFDHAWRKQMSGGAPYVATMTLRGRESRIVFESALVGVSSELPPPLSKSAAESVPMRIEIVPLEGGDRITVAYGSNVLAEFARRGTGDSAAVQRAAVVLGSTAAGAVTPSLKLPETSGILLSGSLPALNLDRWLPYLVSGSGDAASASGAGLTSFDLRLGTLDAFGKRLNRVTLRGTAEGPGWGATLAAQEMSGQLSYRSEGRGRLSGRFSEFSIPADYPGAPKGDAARELPAVDLVAESMTYRDRKIGRVEVVAQHEAGNWRIDKLANVTPDSMLSGKGVWRTGGESRTSMEIDMTVSDIGRFFDRYGHPSAVRGGTAKVHGNLTWGADPLAIDYSSLSGEVTLEAINGQVLEIEQGLGKVLSLFRLDIADAFGTGFAFSRITGSGKIERGVLRTQDVHVRGSSADIFMQGESDLGRETQNLRLRVVPSLSDGVSSVAGFFAGPVVGLVSLLAQRLLKNPLGQMFAFEYTVIGTWSDPKVARVGGTQVSPPQAVDDTVQLPPPAAQVK